MYISESRLVGGESQENDLIGPGSQTICHAMANVSLKNKDKENLEVKVKLDSCGSVSIAHSHLLTEVKETKAYRLRNIARIQSALGGYKASNPPWTTDCDSGRNQRARPYARLSEWKMHGVEILA